MQAGRAGGLGDVVEGGGPAPPAAAAALPGGGVLVRDTKNREGGTQAYTDHEWRVFIAGAKHGEFDLPD